MSLRVGWAGFAVHFKQLSRSPFDLLVSAVWPLVNATLAYFMYRSGHSTTPLLYASLGATVTGIWSMTTVAAGGSVQNQRRLGTLELLVAAPVPFALVLLPITLAISSIGIYSLFSTLLWGRLVFGIPLHIVHPFAFVVAVPVAILGIGLLGFMLATCLVRFRTAWSLANSLEYPVWLVTGLLFPLTVLPIWSRPISWALAPTFGVNAIREAALGGTPWPDMAACAALGGAYLVVGMVMLGRFLDAARRRATLALS